MTPPGHGIATVNPDNTITYAPDADFNGADSFTYTVSDGNGGVDTAAVSITVIPVNDAPVAVADSAATAEDTPVAIAVLSNDSDVDGDTLSVTAVTTPSNGTVVVNPDGSISYTPAADFYGGDSFAYTASDGQGGSDTATVSITVTAINDDPLAVDDAVTTPEDTSVTVNVLANDTDVDGDTLTVAAVSTPAHGSVVINGDNTVTYTPDTDYFGPDGFSYTVDDGQGGADTATVTISVTPVNDAPVAGIDATATDEDTPVIIDVLANDDDVDGDPLTVTAVTTATHGSVVINPDNTITYTPDANYHGADSFSYTISDGQGETATASVTVAVNPVNDAPVAVDDSAVTAEDTPVTVVVLANDSDVDGDGLTVVAVTMPAFGTATINPDNTITYAPAPNYNGPDSFSYTIDDGNGDIDTALVTITSTPVNDAPDAVDDATVTDEDTAVTVDVLANDSDVDGDDLSVTAVTTPLQGSAIINPDNTVTYTPAAGYNGSDSFSYTISDGHGGSDTALVTITVTSVNDNPVANDDAATTPEDTGITMDVLANDTDADGDSLTIGSVTQPAHGSVVNNGVDVTYQPNANYYGADSFTYTISDGHGGSDTASVAITVSPVNDSPNAVNDTANTSQDTAVTIDVLANDSDVDGDSLTVASVTQPPAGFAAINPDNTITYLPDVGFNGVDSFTYTVSDGHGGSDTAVVTVNVTPGSSPCELYPIALHEDTLDDAEVGDLLEDILNGENAGNFGWLTWTGDNGVPTLVASLTPPGNSYTYINPYDPNDHVVSAHDWVEGKPGVSNARSIRDALDVLKGIDIIVPVWEDVQGNGANVSYRITEFARVRLVDYQLPKQDRISVIFLGYASCGQDDDGDGEMSAIDMERIIVDLGRLQPLARNVTVTRQDDWLEV